MLGPKACPSEIWGRRGSGCFCDWARGGERVNFHANRELGGGGGPNGITSTAEGGSGAQAGPPGTHRGRSAS